MTYFLLVIIAVFAVLFAAGAIWVNADINADKRKSEKAISDAYRKNEESAHESAQKITEANNEKESIDNGNGTADFISSINVMHKHAEKRTK